MKCYLFILLFLFNVNTLFSQNKSKINKTINTYEKAIKAGKKAVKDKKFDDAVNYFFAAEAYDPSRRQEVEGWIDTVFNRIQVLKTDAEKAKGEAIKAKDAAVNALAEASRQRLRAEKEKERAKKNEDAAIEAKNAAEKSEDAAIEAKDAAKLAETAAVEAKELEKNATKIAKEATIIAERLRIEALSVSAALKSISMESEYQNTIKGLLAIEAFNMQKTMLEDSTKKDKTWLAPEIYTALHSAMVKIKGRDYDEFPKVDTGHIGAVRAIFQASEKRIYTSSSDGKIILWEINKWKQNGKPTLSKVVSVRQEEEIITTSAIKDNGKEGKELIAIGGRFSTVELIEPKKDKVRNPKLKGKKNRSYDYETLRREKIKDVCDMAFKGNLLYTLGKDSTIRVYDTETAKAKILITLKQKAEHIAVHPNGNIIAVGYKAGNIGLLDINKLDKPLYELTFKKKELVDKPITALVFEENNQQLAFGTSDGYIGLIPMVDNKYNGDDVKFRKSHSYITSAIDFKTFSTSDSNDKPLIVMAVGNYDGTVSIWSLSEFENKLYTPFLFDGKGTFVTSLKFVNTPSSPDNNQLMVGYFDGTIKFWNMDINSLANNLQCVLKSKFKREKLLLREIQDYGLNIKDFKLIRYADSDCGSE